MWSEWITVFQLDEIIIQARKEIVGTGFPRREMRICPAGHAWYAFEMNEDERQTFVDRLRDAWDTRF